MAAPVSLPDAKAHLSRLVDRAAAGEVVIKSKNGNPLARLVPLGSKGARRIPAGALSVVRIGLDLDDALPSAFQAAFEGNR